MKKHIDEVRKEAEKEYVQFTKGGNQINMHIKKQRQLYINHIADTHQMLLDALKEMSKCFYDTHIPYTGDLAIFSKANSKAEEAIEAASYVEVGG